MEPEPARGMPTAPSFLSGRGKYAFRELAQVLDDMHVLTVADRIALALLCDAYADYLELTAFLRKEGRTYTVLTTAGSKVQGASAPANTLGCTLPGMEQGGAVDPRPPAMDVEGATSVKLRPEVVMRQDAWRRVMSGLAEFGLTPSARTKIQTVDGGKVSDPMEQFLANRRN
jgi:P27 family predicted phage terminase small subunit